MVVAEFLEGAVDDAVSFHYDMVRDVLYLRLLDHKESPAIGEDTSDDLTLFRHEETDEVIGLDVISWWKRFGEGKDLESLREVEDRIEAMAHRLLSEAATEPHASEPVAT